MNRRTTLAPRVPETVAVRVEVWPAMRLARMAVEEIRDNALLASRLRPYAEHAAAHRLALVELHTAAREMRPLIRAVLAAGWNPAQFRRRPTGGSR